MKVGLAVLVLGYLLSQFYRAFLAVLSPLLIADLGVTAADLSHASGFFLLAFAAMQIPIGEMLDRVGPARMTALLVGVCGGGGALLFANAQSATTIQLAMALLGAGCAPTLMAAYYILARSYPARMFSTIGAVIVAAGSTGNLASTLPLAWAAETWGWRAPLAAMSALTVAVAVLVWLLVKGPPPHEGTAPKGSFLTVLAIPQLWPMLPLLSLNYVVIGLSGLWIGPYLTEAHGLSPTQVGSVALLVSASTILGTLVYGPLDRLLGTRKWALIGGNGLCGLSLVGLAAWPVAPLPVVTVLLCLTLFFGASYALSMAHARSFAPPHLAGRAVGTLNFFSIGGAGLMQSASGWVHATWPAWPALFLFFGLPLLLACAVYTASRDNLG